MGYVNNRNARKNEQGFVLLAAGVCCIVAVASLGLAVDLGRVLITKNEAQTYVDSAALDAVMELDGTFLGLDRARQAVAGNLNRAQLGTTALTGVTTEFATSAAGPWLTNPVLGDDMRFLRVRADSPVTSYFMPVVGGSNSTRVVAQAVAGQVEKTTWREGSFPFSPLAHDNTAPHFGLIPGQIYTLRWAANPRLGVNTCAGDDAPAYIAQAEAGGGAERGYIEDTSSAIIREAIEGNLQTAPLEVGQTVNMTGGAKQTQRDSIRNRVGQDTDATSATYAAYSALGTGNGRRLVIVPVNTWHPNYQILGFRAFFLLPAAAYPNGGNSAFCAEYVGSYSMGSKHKGVEDAGAFVPRLVE